MEDANLFIFLWPVTDTGGHYYLLNQKQLQTLAALEERGEGGIWSVECTTKEPLFSYDFL